MKQEELIRHIKENKLMLIAIDGRCGSGKSTLAERISFALGAQVIHMDDFFLQVYQRTEKRYATPGENVDHERFLAEVLRPLAAGRDASWHPFSHETMSLSKEVHKASAGVLTVVEGTYSLHPCLRSYYDLKVFSDVEPSEQMRRIERRNPATAHLFKERWIPLEELYFDQLEIRKIADIFIRND